MGFGMEYRHADVQTMIDCHRVIEQLRAEVNDRFNSEAEARRECRWAKAFVLTLIEEIGVKVNSLKIDRHQIAVSNNYRFECEEYNGGYKVHFKKVGD